MLTAGNSMAVQKEKLNMMPTRPMPNDNDEDDMPQQAPKGLARLQFSKKKKTGKPMPPKQAPPQFQR